MLDIMAFNIAIFLGFLVFGNAQLIEDERMTALLSAMSSSMQENDAPAFDLENADDLTELRRILEDYGFDSNKLSSDLGILSSLPGIFMNGDGKRWTTLNFAYQLACYQGIGGLFITQALWALGKYNNYGCYCGSGDYFGNFLDATDSCCKTHDGCYTRALKRYGLFLGCHTYTTPYSVSCCKDKKYTKCTDSGPSAGRALCECDQAMASCVAKSAGSYNEKLKKNRSQCSKSFTRKPMSFLDILKSCKHAFNPVKKFPVTYGSQGTCPKNGEKWWWGKK